MLQNVFAVNGKYYNVRVVGLKRGFQILDNEENAGRTITGIMVRDIIGTYYNYVLNIEPVRRDMDSYNELYDLVSSPIDYVSLTILLGNQRQTFNAYVTNGGDDFKLVDGVLTWTGLSLSFVAMDPQRRP